MSPRTVAAPFISKLSSQASQTYAGSSKEKILEVGQLVLVAEACGLKDYVIKRTVNPQVDAARNLVHSYRGAKFGGEEQDAWGIVENDGQKTDTYKRFTSTREAPKFQSLRNRSVRRVKSLFTQSTASNSTSKDDAVTFELLDVDVTLRETANITYRTSFTHADAILFLVPQDSALCEITEQLAEMQRLRKNPDVPVIVVSARGADIRKLSSSENGVYVCDVTRITSSSKDGVSEKLVYEKLAKFVKNLLKVYAKVQERKDVDDFMYYGD